MAVARVQTDNVIEFTDDVLAEFGIHKGDEFRVERIGGHLTLVPKDPLRAFEAAIAKVDEAIRNGATDPEGTLPPISAAEEAAIERYERIVRERHEEHDQ